MSRVLAGPLAAMTLGDLGADVIKVERPHWGDDTRGWGPPFDARGESAYYLSCNRNKRSVVLDLDREGDRETTRTLIAGADVVIENFKGGSLERRGLQPLAMLAAHPRLLWCSISGFGRDDPRGGYDFVLQAEAGWMSVTGPAAGAPSKTATALVDVLTGRDAAIAILAALAGGRDAAPADRWLQPTLHQSALAGLINVAQSALVTGRAPQRWGNAHAQLVPYELFDASDRAIVIAVGTDEQYTSFARLLGDPLLAEQRFARNAGRVSYRAELVPVIAARIRTRTADDWKARFDDAGIPCGLVRTVLEALGEVTTSPLTGIAPLAPMAVRLPPPTLDEHGEAIRARGWDAIA
jgi:crotonobetainyl-CoA:carnitine CoA-transferase CaiB-like acyl-CoA transferase